MSTLFDILMEVGDLYDKFNILIKGWSFHTPDETKRRAMTAIIGTIKKQLEECAQFVNELIIKLNIDPSKNPNPACINIDDKLYLQFQAHGHDLKTKLDNGITALNLNKHATTVSLARKRVCELLKSEEVVVSTCREIDFGELVTVLGAYQTIDNETLEFLNYLGKDYFSIENTLKMNSAETDDFSKNLFTILPLLESHFGSAKFMETFEAQENIARKYKLLLDKIKAALASDKMTPQHRTFLFNVQNKLAAPVQRTMRYKLLLIELQQYMTELFKNRFYTSPKIGTNMVLSSEIAKDIIPRLIHMFEIKVKNINTEQYLMEVIESIRTERNAYPVGDSSVISEALFKKNKQLKYNGFSILNALEERIMLAIERKSYTDKNIVADAINEIKQAFPPTTSKMNIFLSKLLVEADKRFQELPENSKTTSIMHR